MTTQVGPDLPEDPFEDDVSDTPISRATLGQLERDSKTYNWWGIGFFVFAAMIGCTLVVVSYVLTVAAKQPSMLSMPLRIPNGCLFFWSCVESSSEDSASDFSTGYSRSRLHLSTRQRDSESDSIAHT